MNAAISLRRRRSVGCKPSGAQILNACCDPKKQKDDEKEPNKAHSPHHSQRHVSHSHHHVSINAFLNSHFSTRKKRDDRTFVFLPAVTPTAVRR
jgi:hypothetical protein